MFELEERSERCGFLERRFAHDRLDPLVGGEDSVLDQFFSLSSCCSYAALEPAALELGAGTRGAQTRTVTEGELQEMRGSIVRELPVVVAAVATICSRLESDASMPPWGPSMREITSLCRRWKS